ncbi:HEPN domain-containing protein [Bacillus sp. FSL W7-1360]
MSKVDGIFYGKWTVSTDDNDFVLNGYLEMKNERKKHELTLYSDEYVKIKDKAELIFCKTMDGVAFTLYKCILCRSSSSSIIHRKTNYIYRVHSHYMFVNALFTSVEEIRFKEATFSVTNLDKWAHQDSIDIKFNREAKTSNDALHTITTKQLESVVHENEQFKLQILYTVSPDYGHKSGKELKVSANKQFHLIFRREVDINTVHRIINKVMNFMTFCTSISSYIEYINVFPYSQKADPINLIAHVYGYAIDFCRNGTDKENEMLLYSYLKLEDIKESFDKCMRNWFEKYDLLSPVIDLYMTTKYHRTSRERFFLNVVQAAEAYHRLMRPQKSRIPQSEFNQKRDEILASIPEAHRPWLKEKLHFANEMTLHERLNDLFTIDVDLDHPEGPRYYHLFRPLNTDKQRLIRDIKNTRNYNTHFPRALKKKAKKGEELSQLIDILIVVLEYHLMTEIQVDKQKVLDICWERWCRIDHID